MSTLLQVGELAKNRTHKNPYGYDVTLYVCIIFVVLFSLSTAAHLGQAVWTRRWFLIPSIVLGGIGECIGWAARLWSSKNVLNATPFLMQISTTIIAPTFLAAANFIILGTIINRAGAQYSRLPAAWYSIIFISIDLIALVIQAIGGGMASAATQKVDGDPNKGGHVMLIGIIVQLAEIFVYVCLASDFFLNYSRGKSVRTPKPSKHASHDIVNGEGDETAVNSRTHTPPNGSFKEKSGLPVRHGRMTSKEKLMSYGLAFSTLTLLIRAIYRTAELSDGWGGRIIHTQVYFNVLDGAMIVLSMYTLNFLHPGFLL